MAAEAVLQKHAIARRKGAVDVIGGNHDARKMRSCTVAQLRPEGIERNIFFAEEGWWGGEMDSFINQVPSTMSMQALEDCELLTLDRERWEYATRNFPDYALYQIKNRGRTVAWLKNLLSNMITDTPDEKYRRVLKENPHWMNRFSQYHIASYLGITPDTLSRIRKRNMHL